MYDFFSPEASLGSTVLNNYPELSGMEFEYLSFNNDYGYGTIKICTDVIWTTALENAQYILHIFIGLFVFSGFFFYWVIFNVFLNLIFREMYNWWILPFSPHSNSLFFGCATTFYISCNTICKCLLFCSLFFRKLLSISTSFYVFLSFL